MVSNLLDTIKRYFKVLGLFGYRQYVKVYSILVLDFLRFIEDSDYEQYLTSDYQQMKNNILHSIYSKQYELQNMLIQGISCSTCSSNTGYLVIDDSTKEIQLNADGKLDSGNKATIKIYSNVKWNITAN